MKKVPVDLLRNFLLWVIRNSRIIFIWLILLLTFLLFENRISNLLANHSIITREEVENGIFYQGFILVNTSIIFLFIWLFFKNYRISKQYNFSMILLAVFYLVLRYNQSDKLNFISIENENEKLSNYYYADIFILVGGCMIILFLRNLFKDFTFYSSIKIKIDKLLFIEEKSTYSIYKEDLPIEGNKPEVGDKIIDKLLPKINQLTPLNAFIIGINAGWGHGKTSFLKRLEYKLKNDQTQSNTPITFWFNAWQHHEEKSIISNFFNLLKKELSVYSGDAKSSINLYLNKIFNLIGENTAIKLTNINILNTDSSIDEYYSDIQNLINRIDKKIIVFVDDLDRLNKEEISEIIRILRNVANFKNIFFICGFDKEYVLKMGGLENNFLDKIFNLEINLPKFHQNGLLIFFKDVINSSEGINNKKIIIEAIGSIFKSDTETHDWAENVNSLVGNESEPNTPTTNFTSIPLRPSLFFETRRDVKRFYNSIVTDLDILENINDVLIQDYLLFKLLVFKYSWMLNQFDNKRINLWLGSEKVLRVDNKNLNFLNNREELETIDRITIYSVLERLFPSNFLENSKDSGIAINQRRYLPIYINNNLFNQAFSHTNLISSHKKLEIAKLIQNKVLGQENENYLLNDIKSFILKKENLDSIKEFEQAVDLINKYLPNTSDYELIQLIDYGTEFDGFKDAADKTIFIDIENVLGVFLRNLNKQYTTITDGISLTNDDLNSYFYRRKTEELEIINKVYVKNKMVELYDNYLKSTRTLQEATTILFDCTETHFDLFNLSFFNKDATDLFKSYLDDNFEKVFLSNPPEEVMKYLYGNLMASIFSNKKDKDLIKQQAVEALKNGKGGWQSHKDLNQKAFNIAGWTRFLDFFEEKYYKKQLNPEDVNKANKFYAFVNAYIKKGLLTPSEQEVQLNYTEYLLKKNM